MNEAELQREIQRREYAETLQASQQSILRLIATCRPLEQVLGALVEAVEKLFRPSLCAVLVYERGHDCLNIGAAPSIAEAVRSLIDGTPLGPDLNSFAAAAFRRETVVVTDIAHDETCGAAREAALKAGYRSCWAHPALGPDGQLLGVIGMYNRETRAPSEDELAAITDFSDLAGIAIGHERAEQRMRLLSSALEQTDDAVMIMDRDGAIEYVNPAYERITGNTRHQVIGKTIELVDPQFHEPGFDVELWNTIRGGKVFREVFVNRRRDGEVYYEEKTITPFSDAQDKVTHFVATGKDITQHMEAQKRLQYLAHHDPLTGLANRALLFDHLDNALAQAQRSDHMVALLYADLDRFKSVNDCFGHATGDHLLKAVAERLRSCVREADTVARLGGDEFVILLPSVRHVDEPAHVAQNLLETLHAPFITTADSSQELFSNASIGITIYPIDAEDTATLLRNADQAMYRAKSRGGDVYEFYAQYMTDQTNRHLDMEHKLRHALERNELSLHYQPRVDAASGEVCAIEALLRWSHPEFGEVAASEFVPLLEETGLILPVGRWALQTACSYARTLQTARPGKFRVAVNLSPRQLRDSGLVEFIRECLGQQELDGSVLELEITESLLIEHTGAAVSTLETLHDLGVHISIDDFGTGYAALAYLKRFSIDRLKIDRTFVNDVVSSADDQAIVKAIVAMARSLGYRTTAEGVETPEQLALLRAAGCDELQGFYFSRPLSAGELGTWLSRH
jgi:diguanylate cyclase (GGDEF)-like protein/PAS domain S-box-containing protein